MKKKQLKALIYMLDVNNIEYTFYGDDLYLIKGGYANWRCKSIKNSEHNVFKRKLELRECTLIPSEIVIISSEEELLAFVNN